MREKTKWIFYILVVAFVGWLVVDVGMGLTGGGTYSPGDAVIKVNGESVNLNQYQTAYQNALEQVRQQNRSGPLTREDEQELQEQVVEQLIQTILLQQAYARLGLYATEREIQEAARSSPPPELIQVAQFQTDGQFDPAKWQRFLASGADPQFLLALEARYRDEIPRMKLAQYLTADVYVSDAKLWRIYRDQHDSIAALVVSILPTVVPDSAVTITDADLERYLRAHEDVFKRPAAAHVSFVALPRLPDAADSAATRARAARLRTEAARSADAFAEVAKRESADSVSGKEGGDLGWIKPAAGGYDPQFLQALRRLRPGQLSPPVETQYGVHLIRVDQARGDSVRARHVLVAFDLRDERRDTVEARADTLDRLASIQSDGRLLDSAARVLGLPLGTAPVIYEGQRLELGRYVIPDVGVWAFEARVGETSPVIEAAPAFYVFRLDSAAPERVPSVSELRVPLTAVVRAEKKKALLDATAQQLSEELRAAPDLEAAAAARGLGAERFGPFTRLNPTSFLAREPLVTGTVFGLSVRERSGLVKGRDGYYVVQLLRRVTADSAKWLAQRDTQREALMQAARQARIRAYMEGLRAKAKVVDRRKEIFRAPTAEQQQASGG
jgi:peptidyl-prolyl cis-trans isomerase D